MNEKTLKMLEYKKIIAMLEKHAVTYLGKEKCENLAPLSDINEIDKLQKETSEANSLLLKYGTPPIAVIIDYNTISQKIKIGGVLSIGELLNIANILKIMREIKAYFNIQESTNYPIIGEYFMLLYSNHNVEKEIYRCIKSDEELDDRASAELYNIRRHIADAEAKIKDKLNDFIHGASSSKFLQEQLITIRNDRYVIPVKAEYKNEVKGFVHDSSASGSTIFIEPTSIFNINNEIKDLKIKEQLEIQRILSLLTQMVDPISEEISSAIEQLANLDFAFAKAGLALEMEAYEPKLNNTHYINLKRARHPLIDKDIVVPIDIKIGKEYKSLIITGPNTGGKTVTLKTVGLLTLMAQSGLHIPALESSEVCIFENVYADIGDEQSIEQCLYQSKGVLLFLD